MEHRALRLIFIELSAAINLVLGSLLTYMSIRVEINQRIYEKRLWQLNPMVSTDPCVRWMFITEEIRSFLIGPWDSTEDQIRAGVLRAYMDEFSKGNPISLDLRPYDKNKAVYMAALDPVEDNVFTIRNRDKPSIRVFGSFAKKDVFVATVWDYRNNLGGPNSKEWRDLRERSKAVWRQLFNQYQSFSGATPDDYASKIIPQ